MKALWVHTFPDSAQGSGVFMHELADAMRRLGWDIRLWRVPAIESLRSFFSVIRELRKEADRVDIVHAQYGSKCGLLPALADRAQVITVRGSDWYGVGYNGAMSWKVRSDVIRAVTRCSLSKYDRVIVVSRRMAAEVERVTRRRPTVIPSGIDLQKFRPIERQDARRYLGLSHDTSPWVLFSSVTDSNPVKRANLAREAIEYAKTLCPQITMKYLHGVSPDDVPLWLNASNVVLLTSSHEGWPNIVKEAMACNVPFVSTDVSDLAAIAQAAASCEVCRADAAALGSALVRAVQAPRPNELRSLALSFDVNKIALDVAALYEDVLKNGKSNATALSHLIGGC